MSTLVSLLFDSPQNARMQLGGILGRQGLDLESIKVGGLSVQAPDVSEAVTKLLDLPVLNMAIEGWHKWNEVHQAKLRTAAEPGTRVVVGLAHHTIKCRQEPIVKATYGGVSVPVLRLSLKIEMRISSARIVVERGEFIEIQAGQAVVKAKLASGDTTLIEREFQPIDLSFEDAARVTAVAP